MIVHSTPGAAALYVLSRQIELHYQRVVSASAADDVHDCANALTGLLHQHRAAHKVLRPELIRILRPCVITTSIVSH